VSDRPDYTRPVSIEGVTIESLPIDIVAQTVGNIGVDIAAQSLGQVNVNLAASAITLNVAIQSSAVTLNVNIESIAAGVVFNVAQSGTWTINAAQSGTWTINIGAPLDANGRVETHLMESVQLDVNIAAQAVTLNIAITSPVDAVTGYVQVDITAQSVGNLGVDIKAQSVGNIAIDIAAQTVGNLNVNIAAQAADINVNVTNATINITGTVTVSAGSVEITALKSTIYTSESPIVNPDFELGDYGWTLLNDAVITDVEAHKGTYSVKLPAGKLSTAQQTFVPRLDTLKIAKIMFWAKGASGDYAQGYLFFEDGTEQTETFALTGNWVLCTIYPKRGKKIRFFAIMQRIQNANDYYADDISVELIDPLQSAYLHYWRYEPGKIFVELWENGYFDQRKYKGRTGSYFRSEHDKPEGAWTSPILVLDARGVGDTYLGNAVHLRNSIDGTTPDEVYFSLKQAYRRCIMKVNAKIPDPSTLPSGTHLYIGFEATASGGMAIATLEVFKDGARIYINRVGKNGLVGNHVDVTINNPGVFASYYFVYDPPYLRFYQQASGLGSLTHTATVTAPKDAFIGYELLPFFANESESVVSDFYIGWIQLWGFDELKRPAELVIDETSISASGEAHYDLLGLQNTNALAVTVRVTYNASATAGVRVYLLASGDSINWDSENTTDAFAYFEPKFGAGETHQRTVNVDALPRFIRVLVRNLDGVYATGAVKVWVTEAEVR